MDFFAILKFIFICIEVVLLFNLMIVVHELGHFLAARWRGLVVEKFAIWFGKPIWSKTINGVEYRLGSIPAGGFVAIPQLAPMEALEGKTETDRNQLPPVKPIDKIIVAAAGPAFSLGLAFFFAVLVWIVGKPTSEAEKNTVIGYVAEDGPAAKAGLHPGDEILSVNGVPVTQFAPSGNGRGSIVWNVVRSEGEQIPITYQRDGKTESVEVTPVVPQREGWGRKNLRSIGISPAMTPRIATVAPGSPEAAAGFEAKDFILTAQGQKLYSMDQLGDVLENSGGKPVPVTIERNGSILEKEMPPLLLRINEVQKDSPAAAAGLRKGDVITAVNGTPVSSRMALANIVRESKGAPIQLTIEGQAKTVTMTPQIPSGEENYRIGIVWDFGGIKWDMDGRPMPPTHPNPVQQITSSVTTMWDTITAVAFSHSGIGLQHLSGPVGIMNLYYRLFEREQGWMLALWFSVVLNVNLAIMNLLPIPVLDGGHITLAIVEAIRRRPINVKVLEVVQTSCALLIIGFMLYVTFYDTLDLPWARGGGKFRPAAAQTASPSP